MTTIVRKQFIIAAALLLAAGALQAGSGRAQRLSPLSDSLRKVTKVPSAAAREVFRKFSARQGKGWQVRYDPRTALPESLEGGRTSGYPGTPEQAAMAFFSDNRDLLKVDPQALRLALKKEYMGVTHLQYQQYKDGLPVEFSYARVHISARGEVSGYQGRFEPDISVNTVPAISAGAAAAAAAADLGLRLPSPRTELVIYPDEISGTLKLAWKVRGRANGLWVYYVDASDGKVLFRYDDLRRAACTGFYPTFGASSATVYAISPLPAYDPNSIYRYEYEWQAPVIKPLRDQYVWVADYSTNTVTDKDGDYCSNTDGKVFSSIKGPYFSVTNFRGASAHWDNAAGEWRTQPASVQSLHPYADSQTVPYPVSVPLSLLAAGEKFAKVMPYFSSFDVGALDVYGSLNDDDEVSVGNSASGTSGVYIGQRTAGFYGAAVENPSYTVTLKADAAGTHNGFSISGSRYLVLPSASDPVHANNATGSVIWSTSNASVSFMNNSSADAKPLGEANALSEVNAFYHLNAARHYFDALNVDPMDSSVSPADLSKRVPVMVHAHGEADRVGTTACSMGDPSCNGMLNAFYDLENDNIMIGDGQIDLNGKYRSFALDGTIVRHEYIHLVINRIYPIINFGEFGAISEALADYFALSSFWNEGYTGAPYPLQTVLGNYVGAGEGAARDISGGGNPTGLKVMPANWTGEVHDDGLIVSQALYSLRLGTRSLGNLTGAPFAGRPAADVLTFAALFYFPDNFYNLRDAMKDACKQLEPYGCTLGMRTNIDNAFADHGIGTITTGDAYETGDNAQLCGNNDGPECAAELGNDARISPATIYPLGDVDYYSLPLAAGAFKATLHFPAGAAADTFNAYSLFLFDSERNIMRNPDGTDAVAVPVIYSDPNGQVCPDTGDCLTLDPSVTLNCDIPAAGRYYLVVSAAPTSSFGNSSANSQTPYSVDLSRSPLGSAQASILTAAYDNDGITFNVPYNKFAMAVAPSSSTLNSAEQVFEFAQLRDHNYAPIDLTRAYADGSGMYMKLVGGTLNTATTDIAGRPILSGQVRLQPGFGARYPGIGTVYLEIFGRNHLGQVLSMGVSNAVNLSANRSAATAYNNIITAGSSALVKYELLSAGTLTVKVYTQSGSLVKTLFDGPVTAGKGTLEWDGANSTGGKAASGIYFVKTKGPGLNKIVKIAVVR